MSMKSNDERPASAGFFLSSNAPPGRYCESSLYCSSRANLLAFCSATVCSTRSGRNGHPIFRARPQPATIGDRCRRYRSETLRKLPNKSQNVTSIKPGISGVLGGVRQTTFSDQLVRIDHADLEPARETYANQHHLRIRNPNNCCLFSM